MLLNSAANLNILTYTVVMLAILVSLKFFFHANGSTLKLPLPKYQTFYLFKVVQLYLNLRESAYFHKFCVYYYMSHFVAYQILAIFS